MRKAGGNEKIAEPSTMDGPRGHQDPETGKADSQKASGNGKELKMRNPRKG